MQQTQHMGTIMTTLIVSLEWLQMSFFVYEIVKELVCVLDTVTFRLLHPSKTILAGQGYWIVFNNAAYASILKIRAALNLIQIEKYQVYWNF